MFTIATGKWAVLQGSRGDPGSWIGTHSKQNEFTQASMNVVCFDYCLTLDVQAQTGLRSVISNIV